MCAKKHILRFVVLVIGSLLVFTEIKAQNQIANLRHLLLLTNSRNEVDSLDLSRAVEKSFDSESGMEYEVISEINDLLINSFFRPAIAESKKLRELVPGHGLPMYYLGLAYLGIDKPDSAFLMFSDVLRSKNTELHGHARIKKGLIALVDEEFERAEAEFVRARELMPGSAAPYYWEAVSNFNQVRYLKARTLVNKSLEIEPEYIQSHVLLSIIHMANRRSEAAKKDLDVLLELDPDNYNAKIIRGLLCESTNNKIAECTQFYEDAIRTDSTKTRAYWELGPLLHELKLSEFGFNQIIKAIKIENSSNTDFRGMDKQFMLNEVAMYMHENRAHYSKEDFLTLTRAFFFVQNSDYRRSNRRIGLADTLDVATKWLNAIAKDQKNDVSCIEQFNELNDTLGGVFSLHFRAGERYFKLRELEKAIENFMLAYSIEPRNIYLLQYLGDAYRLNKHYVKAIGIYTILINSNGADYASLLGRASSYYGLGAIKEAIIDLDGALNFDIGRFDLWGLKSSYHLMNGDTADAIISLTNSIIEVQDEVREKRQKFEAEHEDQRDYINSTLYDVNNIALAESYNRRGALYFTLGRELDALNDFTKAISYRDQPYALLNRGLLYYQKEDFEKAIEDFNRVLDTYDENEPNALYYKGMILLAENETKEGIRLIKRAARYWHDLAYQYLIENGIWEKPEKEDSKDKH